MSFLQKHIAERAVPILIVGCKADQKPVLQDYELQPNQFCRKHRLPPPYYVSVADKLSRDVYFKIASMAAYPWVHVEKMYSYISDSFVQIFSGSMFKWRWSGILR